MKNALKAALTFSVIFVAIFIGYGLVMTRPEPPRVEPREQVTTIRTEKIERTRMRLTVRSQGTVAPRTASELVPEVSGRVQWMSPNLVAGGYFEADEVLLKLDNRDHRNGVERTQAAVARARAEAEHAEFEYGRLQELVKKNLTSQSNLEAALRTRRITKASLRDAEISLTQAQRDLMRTEIRAPYAGLVRSEKIDLGQFVQRGQSIASIYAGDAVEISLPVADSQLAYLDIPLGSRGELDPAVAPDVLLTTEYGGQHYEWQGKIVRTEAEIDARSRMINVVARVKNTATPDHPPLPIGLFVSAVISGRWVDNVVSLPRAALRNENQVLVVDADNRLRYRTVELLRFDLDDVIISSGLETGDVVNLSPLQTVIDGMRVAPMGHDIAARAEQPATG